MQAEWFDDPVGFLAVGILGGDSHLAPAQPQGHFDTVGHPGPRRFPGRDPVDDNLDGVPSLAVNLGDLLDPAGRPVDADSSETVLLK